MRRLAALPSTQRRGDRRARREMVVLILRLLGVLGASALKAAPLALLSRCSTACDRAGAQIVGSQQVFPPWRPWRLGEKSFFQSVYNPCDTTGSISLAKTQSPPRLNDWTVRRFLLPIQRCTNSSGGRSPPAFSTTM